MDIDLKAQEIKRFVILKNSMFSEVKVGKTVFSVSSKLNKADNSFKDVVGRITQRQIDRINKDAG